MNCSIYVQPSCRLNTTTYSLASVLPVAYKYNIRASARHSFVGGVPREDDGQNWASDARELIKYMIQVEQPIYLRHIVSRRPLNERQHYASLP